MVLAASLGAKCTPHHMLPWVMGESDWGRAVWATESPKVGAAWHVVIPIILPPQKVRNAIKQIFRVETKLKIYIFFFSAQYEAGIRFSWVLWLLSLHILLNKYRLWIALGTSKFDLKSEFKGESRFYILFFWMLWLSFVPFYHTMLPFTTYL